MCDKSYQWNPSDYAGHSLGQLAWAEELIERLHLRGPEYVLDVGCGNGRVTSRIAHRLTTGGRVLGVDSSEAMVHFAIRNYPLSQYPNLSFQRMDARDLTLTEACDTVFSNAALHWISDHPRVLSELAGVLKTGGEMLLQMGGRGNASGLLSALDEVMESPPWKHYFSDFDFPYAFYDVNDYGRWLPEAGFGADRLELLEKDMQHESREYFAGWIRTTWMPYTSRIPDNERDRFIDQVVEGYLRKHPVSADGRVHVHMVRLEVQAHRL